MARLYGEVARYRKIVTISIMRILPHTKRQFHIKGATEVKHLLQSRFGATWQKKHYAWLVGIDYLTDVLADFPDATIDDALCALVGDVEAVRRQRRIKRAKNLVATLELAQIALDNQMRLHDCSGYNRDIDGTFPDLRKKVDEYRSEILSMTEAVAVEHGAADKVFVPRGASNISQWDMMEHLDLE